MKGLFQVLIFGNRHHFPVHQISGNDIVAVIIRVGKLGANITQGQNSGQVVMFVKNNEMGKGAFKNLLYQVVKRRLGANDFKVAADKIPDLHFTQAIGIVAPDDTDALGKELGFVDGIAVQQPDDNDGRNAGRHQGQNYFIVVGQLKDGQDSGHRGQGGSGNHRPHADQGVMGGRQRRIRPEDLGQRSDGRSQGRAEEK